MLAVDTPQNTHKKLSLLSRFSRKSTQHMPANNTDAYNAAVCPPSRLQTRCPARPASSESAKRSHSPHLTKDKFFRKDRSLHTSRARPEASRTLRGRASRDSSSSSSSTDSLRVPAHAMPTSPFPCGPHSHPEVTTWDLYLPPAQVHALYLGFLPQEMCDKWFIYSEGPDAMGKLKVHFHRSWTGMKIAELFVVMDVKGEGAGKIVGVKWDGGEDVANGRMDGDEAKYLVRTTVQSVLGIELESDN